MAKLFSPHGIDIGLRDMSSDTELKHRKTVILMRISTFFIPDATRCSVEETETTQNDPYLEDYEEDLYHDDWDWCTANWKRGCKQCRSTSSHKKPKLDPHKRVKAIMQKKQVKTKENIKLNAEARKQNIEHRLKKRYLERFGYDIYYRRTDHVNVGSRKPTRMTAPYSYVASKRRLQCDGRSGDHPAALLYELKSNDISDDFSRLLVDLQHRDLTPEDYEILLRLDDKVAPKTISESALSSFDTLTLQSASTLIGELCSICMEVYSESQSVKTLPCQHTFHCNCIDTWLSSASLNCPLDGIAVES